VGHAFARAIERFTRLKPNRYGLRAAEFDDLLQARTGGAFDQENFIERLAGAERFTNRMDA
jgi:hypothetical protein